MKKHITLCKCYWVREFGGNGCCVNELNACF